MTIVGVALLFVVGGLASKILKRTMKIGFTLFSYGVVATILTLIIRNIF